MCFFFQCIPFSPEPGARPARAQRVRRRVLHGERRAQRSGACGVIDASSDLKSYTTPDLETMSFEYADHRMTKKTSPEGDKTIYEYASDGSLSQVTKPAGEQTTSIQPGYAQPPGHDAAR